MLILLLVFFTQLFYDCLSHWYVDVMPKEVKAHYLKKFLNAFPFTYTYQKIMKNRIVDLAHTYFEKCRFNTTSQKLETRHNEFSAIFACCAIFWYRHLLFCSPLILILLKVRVLAFASPSSTYGKLQLWRWLNERQREREREREKENE